MRHEVILFDEWCDCFWKLTPWLTGAGARSAEGTDIRHENAEGMAYVGVRVEPPVRLGSEGNDVDATEPEYFERHLTTRKCDRLRAGFGCSGSSRK